MIIIIKQITFHRENKLRLNLMIRLDNDNMIFIFA